MEELKECSGCKIFKLLDCFYVHPSNNKPIAQCRECSKAAKRAHYLKHYERTKQHREEYRLSTVERKAEYDKRRRDTLGEVLLEQKREYYLANKDRILDSRKKYGIENKELISKRASEHKKNNRSLYNESGAHRRAMKISATVQWADREAMISKYSQAKRFGLWLGTPFHVDHIIPLLHPLVCGLHNEHNLQVITARENLVKNNKFNPDDFTVVQTKERQEMNKYFNIDQDDEDSFTGNGSPPDKPPVKPPHNP